MSQSFHIVCPACGATNRIPASRLSDSPKCGKCSAKLFQAMPLDVTGQGLARHIAHNDIPVLVDFWAPWCGPCKMMAPAYAEAAAQLEPQVRLLKLNTEAEPQAGAQYGIRSIPTLMLMWGGRELARQSGAMSARDLTRWVQSVLAERV